MEVEAPEDATVQITSKGPGLGFSIKGGSQHGLPIVVSGTTKGTSAAESLSAGDELLFVNGRSVRGASLQQAVNLLRAAGTDMEITVKHHPNLRTAMTSTDQTELNRMRSEFKRMREKIRSKGAVEVKGMMGAPPARSFPFAIPGSTPSSPSSLLSTSVSTLRPPDSSSHSSLSKQSTSSPSEQLLSLKPPPLVYSKNRLLADHSEITKADEHYKDVAQSSREILSSSATDVKSMSKTVRRGTLPEGWSQRFDLRTQLLYYENHWTRCSTWTDPRSLTAPAALAEYDWSELPCGWRKFTDKSGFVYYVNYDNHTTHWESPSLVRQRFLLEQVTLSLKQQDDIFEEQAATLKEKRTELLKNRDELERLTNQRSKLAASSSEKGQSADSRPEMGESLDSLIGAVVDNIMAINSDIAQLDREVAAVKSRMDKLDKLHGHAQNELSGQMDSVAEAANLAKQLDAVFRTASGLYHQQLEAIEAIERVRRRQRQRSRQLSSPLPANSPARRSTSYPFGPIDESATPETSLYYMLQLPASRKHSEYIDDGTEDAADKAQSTLPIDNENAAEFNYLHLLPDHLTPKCNLELRVEVQMLQLLAKQWQERLDQLKQCCTDVDDEDNWEGVIGQLSDMEGIGSQLHHDWMQLPFHEKLKKVTGMDQNLGN